ncbi:MAG: nucleotidyltransferase [Candidatus Caldatribacteriaceae bacterium]
MPKVDEVLENLGYECRYRSENVSQYVSPLKAFGNIDCLYAFRIASLNMIERAEEREIFGGAIKVKAARPEDLIGLKLQAMRNDSSRREQDLADIRALVALWSPKLDWSLIEEYARVLEMEEVYRSFAPAQGNERGTTENSPFS